MYHIGVDLGTSAVKLLLMKGDGTIVNIVSKEYPLSFPKPGWSEQNPDDWWNATVLGIRELLSKEKDSAGKIAGISFSPIVALIVLEFAEKGALFLMRIFGIY